MQALKLKSLALLLMVFSALCVSAQTGPSRTVTNADMEKYRDARVKADEQYRQTYARKGLPSPEELEKREEERQKRLFALSDQLRAEQLQKGYLTLLAAAAAAKDEPQVVYVASDNNGGFYPVAGGFPGKTRFRNLSNTEMIRDQIRFGRITPWNFGGSRVRFGHRPGSRTGPVFSPRR